MHPQSCGHFGFGSAQIYYTRDDATAKKRAKFYIDSLLCRSGQLRGFTSLRRAGEKSETAPVVEGAL